MPFVVSGISNAKGLLHFFLPVLVLEVFSDFCAMNLTRTELKHITVFDSKRKVFENILSFTNKQLQCWKNGLERFINGH